MWGTWQIIIEVNLKLPERAIDKIIAATTVSLILTLQAGFYINFTKATKTSDFSPNFSIILRWRGPTVKLLSSFSKILICLIWLWYAAYKLEWWPWNPSSIYSLSGPKLTLRRNSLSLSQWGLICERSKNYDSILLLWKNLKPGWEDLWSRSN